MCAQFDNRTLKARNELLCSLEDVLASLQPSTFVDEQLSHYKVSLGSLAARLAPTVKWLRF